MFDYQMEVTGEFQWSGCKVCGKPETSIVQPMRTALGAKLNCSPTCRWKDSGNGHGMCVYVPTYPNRICTKPRGVLKEIGNLEIFGWFFVAMPKLDSIKGGIYLEMGLLPVGRGRPKTSRRKSCINSNRNVPRCPNILVHTAHGWLQSLRIWYRRRRWQFVHEIHPPLPFGAFHRLPAPIHGCGNGTPVAGNGDWHSMREIQQPDVVTASPLLALHGSSVIFSCPIPYWFENWWKLKVQKELVL